MKVLFDARLSGHAGIGRFVEGLLSGLTEIGTDVTALWRPSQRGGWRAEAGIFSAPTINTRTRPFLPAEQLAIPRLLARGRYEIYHSAHLTVPYRARLPVVLTVHDLFPLKWPGHARSRLAASYYKVIFPRALARADAVVAVSSYTYRMVQELLPQPSERIRIIEHGVDHSHWFPRSEEQIVSALMELRISRPYVLYTGTAKWHKNLPTLLRAHEPSLPTLVLAGPTPEELRQAAPEWVESERVRALGRVAGRLLPALYSGAAAVVLPSLHESVGFSALEAMACGTALICSDSGSLPEVVGDAGLRLPATDVDAWTAALRRVVGDEGLRRRLSVLGVTAVRDRSWAKAAQSYDGLYRELA
jgi:glycosyltransferase involved in cell wall biosynthesis